MTLGLPRRRRRPPPPGPTQQRTRRVRTITTTVPQGLALSLVLVIGLSLCFNARLVQQQQQQQQQQQGGTTQGSASWTWPDVAFRTTQTTTTNNNKKTETSSSSSLSLSMEPIDLSVNQLPVIPHARWEETTHVRVLLGGGGGNNESPAATTEDFLPIVTATKQQQQRQASIDLRFRVRPLPGATRAALQSISAHQVRARLVGSNNNNNDDDNDEKDRFFWDSGKQPWDGATTTTNNNNNNTRKSLGAPSTFVWDHQAAPLQVGMIVEWQVLLWDGLGVGPSYSVWSKFGVGPATTHDWTAEWITHPDDYQSLLSHHRHHHHYHHHNRTVDKNHQVSVKTCQEWKTRRPLPMARVTFQLPPPPPTTTTQKPMVSALLVAAGLGMFHVTLNGKPLSSSAVHDPPLTDFTQRVSYRGYDVTRELSTTTTTTTHRHRQQQQQQQHVLGITLGAGWWDHRPIQGAIVFMDYMPRGSLTTIAELHVRYADGTSHVLIPTRSQPDDEPRSNQTTSHKKDDAALLGQWQITKGYIQESNLYTGETIHMNRLQTFKGWDTPAHDAANNNNNKVNDDEETILWVTPRRYKSPENTTTWRQTLQDWAVHQKPGIASWISPIGELVPLPIPPVLPIRRIPPTSVTRLGDASEGRWLVDFGQAMSGVVRFENGLPIPRKKPQSPLSPPFNTTITAATQYPRAHDLSMVYDENEYRYITVVYGDSLEMTTGDINLALVAGFGHHGGGERNNSKPYNVNIRGGPCMPPEDLKGYQALTQRDVYLARNDNGSGTNSDHLFSQAPSIQPQFSVHGFRFAEICCTDELPKGIYAIQSRTAFQQWGRFSSSNVVFNGAYEMTQNSLESNMLGLQSDCPHRERLQYGGDILSSSPSALHFFDLSAFYAKVIQDWVDSQFSNGAYTVTSVFMNLLNGRSIAGRGSGETVWASVAPIMTVRHVRHYGDPNVVLKTLAHHVEWINFLDEYWEKSVHDKFVDKHGDGHLTGPGLGDWYSIAGAETWLMHHAYYMASARAVAYLASYLLELKKQASVFVTAETTDLFDDETLQSYLSRGLSLTKKLEERIQQTYKAPNFSYSHNGIALAGIGQDLGLFTRVTPWKTRCSTLLHFLKVTASGAPKTWPGNEEKLFHAHLREDEFDALVEEGHIAPHLKRGNVTESLSKYRLRYAASSGIFGIRYTLKSLSDLGFHDVALSKTSGSYMPSFGMMLSFNATSLWETWWRSEDIYSRNHPMFGAIVEWLVSSVAGISLTPQTVGGQEVLFWPRIPTTIQSARRVSFASATQGTKHGDAAIAWKLKETESRGTVEVLIRLVVPPSSASILRLPPFGTNSTSTKWSIRHANAMPDLRAAQNAAEVACLKDRDEGKGFPFHWHYDPRLAIWYRVNETKKIGTPCESFLFFLSDDVEWAELSTMSSQPKNGLPLNDTTSIFARTEVSLGAGLYEVTTLAWTLDEDIEDVPGYGDLKDAGPYCSDPDPSEMAWDIRDGEHLI